MGGSKFNRYPVGEEATCAAEVLAKYVWTGDRKVLSNQIDQTIKQIDIPLKANSYSTTPDSIGEISADYQVELKSSTNSHTSLQDVIDGSGSGNWGKKLLWEKTLKEPDLPTTLKSRAEKKYIVNVRLSKEYVNLFERNF